MLLTEMPMNSSGSCKPFLKLLRERCWDGRKLKQRSGPSGRDSLSGGLGGVRHELAQKNKTSGATDEGPIPRGRPKDHFKDAFLIEMLPVWEKFSDRAATFQSNPDTPTPCPFCDFCAKYLGDDFAEALANRYRRALEEPLDIQ